MNKLAQHKYLIRQNIIILIGISLCIYFAYHAIQGERSILRLHALNTQIETMSLKETEIQNQRVTLEKKVRMLRPSSISKDLLEERVRIVLGYKYNDELTVLSN